ncbi:hypothetical protein Cgig2_020822 [Carnegiea gigantea]|uniref:Uncharacterized protein n=1 Tax=Carnegiea gigantea TaxID=171969 RepID=A0A9Q1KJI8_9CARY|nr:hypothetical protein Cgig2_020822 [Carnegiea gigantea]
MHSEKEKHRITFKEDQHERAIGFRVQYMQELDVYSITSIKPTSKKKGIKSSLSGLYCQKNKTFMGKKYSKKAPGLVCDLEAIEQDLEGYEELEKSSLMSQKNFQKHIGHLLVFISATLMEDGGLPEDTNSTTLMKEAIHSISCGYEEKTERSKEFVCFGSNPGSNMVANFDEIIECKSLLPDLALSSRKSTILSTMQLISLAGVWFLPLFLSIVVTEVLELRWSGVSIEDWWRNGQFWVIGGVSAYLFAIFHGLLKVLAEVDTNFKVTLKAGDDTEFGELYLFKWTTLVIPPTTLITLDMVGVVAGASDAINDGYNSWGPLFGKLFFACWVTVHP